MTARRRPAASGEGKGPPASQVPDVPEGVRSLVEAGVERAFRWLDEDEQLLGFLVIESRTLTSMPIDLDPSAPRQRRRAGGLTRGLVPLLAGTVEPLCEYVVENRAELEGFAIVVDAYVRRGDGGDRVDAVCVDAAVRDHEYGFTFAQPYRRGDGGKAVVRDEPLTLLGVFDNPLVHAPAPPPAASAKRPRRRAPPRRPKPHRS